MNVRPYVLLYISERSRPKLIEWQTSLDRYGVGVRGIPYPTNPITMTRTDAEHRLRKADSGLLGILHDTSELVLPGTETPAPRVHLQQVEHACRVLFYWLEDDTLRIEEHGGRVRGYLDVRDGPAQGWWDDRFRMDETGATLTEWKTKTGSKVSARDIAAGDFIAERIRGPLRDFRYFGIVPGRPVEFERLVLDDFETKPFTGDPAVATFGLLGLFRAVANMGIHYRAPVDKRGSVLWDPGLHGGLPTTPKNDPFHEVTYLVHDLGHMLFPRPLYTGVESELMRRAELVANMLSEAFTMVLADMAFVDAIRSTGHEYDYAARRIWPLFEATGLSGAPIPHERLRELLLANGLFCVTGRTDGWERLIAGPGAEAALRAYAETYSKFFRADLVWNAANWRDRTRRPDEFRRWWELVAPIVRAYGLGVETLSHFVEVTGVTERDSLETLVEKIGRHLIRTRLEPVLHSPPPLATRGNRLGRAFARWMCGQLMAHVRYDFLPEVRDEAVMIADALCRTPVRTQEDVSRVRSLFERRIGKLADRGLLAHADAYMFREMVPHVEPKFVGYVNVPETHQEAARRLLEGRTDDIEPGVGLLIREKRGGRVLLQRKDLRHPNPDVRGRIALWGGSVDPGEEPEDALARELGEEFRNRLFIAELMGQARYRRRYRLDADPWPGEYDLYVFEAAVDTETFERWAGDLAEAGAVLEGMAVLLNAEERAELLAHPGSSLCSHDRVIADLLSPS